MENCACSVYTNGDWQSIETNEVAMYIPQCKRKEVHSIRDAVREFLRLADSSDECSILAHEREETMLHSRNILFVG